MRVKRINPLRQVRDSGRAIFFPERHRRKGKKADRRGTLFSQLSAELLDPAGQQLIMNCRMSGIYVFERSWREHDSFLVEDFDRFCGIYVGAETLVIAVMELDHPCVQREFANTITGRKALLNWLGKMKAQVRVSLEATGIYSMECAAEVHG
jgi:hypothetical protein